VQERDPFVQIKNAGQLTGGIDKSLALLDPDKSSVGEKGSGDAEFTCARTNIDNGPYVELIEPLCGPRGNDERRPILPRPCSKFGGKEAIEYPITRELTGAERLGDDPR
jgi:hypothetical protein